MAGRPPIGERAITAAERQRKRRDALRAQQRHNPKREPTGRQKPLRAALSATAEAGKRSARIAQAHQGA